MRNRVDRTPWICAAIVAVATIHATAGVKSEQITTHPAREAAPSKSKKAGKPEAVRS